MFKTTVKIDGMMCGMCEAHINDTVRKSFSVKKVTSSHTKGTAEIISEAKIPEQALREAIDATGYQMTGFSSVPYEKKGLFGFGKRK